MNFDIESILLESQQQTPQSTKSEDYESPIEVEKGGGFLRNLYDYQGGTFIPAVNDLSNSNGKLNTLFGVYLPCVQNIIGVIVFIRLYWVIGVSGIADGLLIIGLCCLCTFLTAISLAASMPTEIYLSVENNFDRSCNEWYCSCRWFVFSYLEIARSSSWRCCWIFILHRQCSSWWFVRIRCE